MAGGVKFTPSSLGVELQSPKVRRVPETFASTPFLYDRFGLTICRSQQYRDPSVRVCSFVPSMDVSSRLLHTFETSAWEKLQQGCFSHQWPKLLNLIL